MEIHNEDNRPHAQRQKVDLTKKVTRETPSAQRSIKTNANTGNNKSVAFVQNTTAAAKKGANAVGNAAGTAGRTVGGVGNVIVTSADSSTAGGAAIAQSVKAAQMAASAAVVSGRAVKTAIKTSIKTVNVIAKVPDTVKRARFANKKGFKRAKRYANRKMHLVKRNFKPHNIAKGVGKAVGGVAKTGAGISHRMSSALENALRSGDSTGTATAGLALQGGRALATGVKVSGKAVKTGTKITVRTVKTVRKIATKVERKIATGTAQRAIKTSAKATAKATEEAAKVSAKTAQATAKATAQFTKAVSAAVGRMVSLIMSTAPFSIVIIGIILLILFGGGMFMVMVTDK